MPEERDTFLTNVWNRVCAFSKKIDSESKKVGEDDKIMQSYYFGMRNALDHIITDISAEMSQQNIIISRYKDYKKIPTAFWIDEKSMGEDSILCTLMYKTEKICSWKKGAAEKDMLMIVRRINEYFDQRWIYPSGKEDY